MGTDVDSLRSFETKIKDRLKNDISDLMPDEALQALVERSIDDVFFKDRTETQTRGYTNTQVTRPSVFHETMKELLEEPFRAIVKEHIAENEEEVLKQMRLAVGENWIQAMFGFFHHLMHGEFTQMEQSMAEKLRNY